VCFIVQPYQCHILKSNAWSYLFYTGTDQCGYCPARKDNVGILILETTCQGCILPHDNGMTVKTKLMIMVEKEDLPSSMGSESWCGICVTQLCQRGGMVNKLITSSTESINISN